MYSESEGTFCTENIIVKLSTNIFQYFKERRDINGIQKSHFDGYRHSNELRSLLFKYNSVFYL